MLRWLCSWRAEPPRAPSPVGCEHAAPSVGAPDDAVLSRPALLALVISGMDAEALSQCSLVSHAWRAAALEAARVLAYTLSPSLAAALDSPALPPAAWLRLARLAEAGALLNDLTPPSDEALADYSLLLEIRDSDGTPVFATCTPLQISPCGTALPGVRGYAYAALPPQFPQLPRGVPLSNLRDTGGPSDLRRLRCSAAFVRGSSAEVARVWRDVPARLLTTLPIEAEEDAGKRQLRGHTPALYFCLDPHVALPQGELALPPCALKGSGVCVLFMDICFTIRPTFGGLGEWLCYFQEARPLLGMLNADTGATETTVNDSALLRVMEMLDWQPLAPPLNPADSLAALSLSASATHATAYDEEADARAAKIWPAYAAALRTLMTSDRARAWLPPRPFAAMMAACERAAHESEDQRQLRCRVQRLRMSYSLLTETWYFDPDCQGILIPPVCGTAAPLRTICSAYCDGSSCPGWVDASTRHAGGRVAAPPPPPPGSSGGPFPSTLLLLEEVQEQNADGTCSRAHFCMARDVSSGTFYERRKALRAWTALLRTRPDGSVQLARLNVGVPTHFLVNPSDVDETLVLRAACQATGSDVHAAITHGFPPHLLLPYSALHEHVGRGQTGPALPPAVSAFCAVRLVADDVNLRADVLTGRAHADAVRLMDTDAKWRLGHVSRMDSKAGLRLDLFGGGPDRPVMYASQRAVHGGACLHWLTVLPPPRDRKPAAA